MMHCCLWVEDVPLWPCHLCRRPAVLIFCYPLFPSSPPPHGPSAARPVSPGNGLGALDTMLKDEKHFAIQWQLYVWPAFSSTFEISRSQDKQTRLQKHSTTRLYLNILRSQETVYNSLPSTTWESSHSLWKEYWERKDGFITGYLPLNSTSY